MHRRPGPVIRWVHHSRPPHLLLPEVLTAYQGFRPNQPVQLRLSITEDQFLSASIREWPSSVATEVLRENRRRSESAFPLNFLNLDDHCCLVQAVDQPSGEQAAHDKVLRSKLAFRSRRLMPEVISPALRRMENGEDH